MIEVILDFETLSAGNLKDCGSAIYAEHPTTDILCVGFKVFAINYCLKPHEIVAKQNDAKTLYDLAADSNVIFIAHNAIFEQRIWTNIMVKKYGYPEIPLERWRCTMAKSYANGLPGSLKDVAKVLQLPVQKDLDGRDNMLSLSKPKASRKVSLMNIKKLAKQYQVDINGINKENWQEFAKREDILAMFNVVSFWTPEEKPEKFEKLYEYNITDLDVCELIHKYLPNLDPVELKTWHYDQQMNKNGIHIDRPLVEKVVDLIDEHNSSMLLEWTELTGLNSPRQRAKVKEWLSEQGIDVENTQKATMAALKIEDPKISRAVEIAAELAKSSVAKYYTMLDMSLPTGLIREIDQYHAAHTGRYGGRGVQFQNLPARVKPLIGLDEIRNGTYAELLEKYPDLMAALSSVLRLMVIPLIGNKLIIGDYSQMEHRVLAWLAGEQAVLDTYRLGKDPYCIEATGIFGYAVEKSMKQERQVGKVAILAMQYAGGIGAFGNMAKQYDLDLHPVAKQIWDSATEEEQDKATDSYQNYLAMAEEPIDEESGLTADIIKQRWRKNNPNIVRFWKDIERAAKAALKPSAFGSKWVLEGNFLICRLPSGRPMVYPYPQIEFDGQLSYFSHTPKAKKTGYREYTHGGKLSENITQAVQRDLMRDALLDMEDEFKMALFHVHDEIVAESHQPEIDLEVFKEIMERVPIWASGLPIDVDAKIVDRYEK